MRVNAFGRAELACIEQEVGADVAASGHGMKHTSDRGNNDRHGVEEEKDIQIIPNALLIWRMRERAQRTFRTSGAVVESTRYAIASVIAVTGV